MPLAPHDECHPYHRTGWPRVVVLGANGRMVLTATVGRVLSVVTG